MPANELSRPEVFSLPRQVDEARARYAEALQQLNEATCFYERTVPKGDQLRNLFPDERERALTIQKAIQDCACWDAEASAAEIRLARLARIALKFGKVSPPGNQEDVRPPGRRRLSRWSGSPRPSSLAGPADHQGEG